MLTRIITGAIGAVAAVGIITTGGWMFSLAVFLLSAIGWYEYHQIAAAKGKNVYYLTSGLGSLLISGFAAFAYYANRHYASFQKWENTYNRCQILWPNYAIPFQQSNYTFT